MKAIWSGAIGFGLVNIPVKLFSAVQESNLDLDMLDKKDHANIRFKRVNEHTGKEVQWNNIVRAYDLKGKYVVLTDADFEEAMPEKTKMIDISTFVSEREIDPLLYEMPYYLQPEKQGKKAYALLHAALLQSEKAGLGSFVLRNKENLCLIKATKDALVLHRLRFMQEIRTTAELDITIQKPKPAELKMALSLIDHLKGSFDVSKYKDTYSAKLMALIKRKAAGKKTSKPNLRIVHSKTSDLMNQLKASFAKGQRKAS